jgi:aminopeptidase N
MHGLYPCYFKHMGKEKILLATQFESHHAREVFPCIDEPEAKATFDLVLTSPNKQKVLANTPIKKQAEVHASKDLVETTFETTPIMSTYLLAFVIGELHSVSGRSKHGVAISSWATVAQPKSHLKYANDEAVRVLDFFTNYFKTPFPLPKLDQVALPDFESLAMENWGLITYREIGLLADPANRSVSGEQLISEVIAHELSHQWFGNLVTMKWWDDLWLNESFAKMMEYLALDNLHPDWQPWEDFAASDVIAASGKDSFKDTQPVGAGVNHPDEITMLFDPAIVYAKGGRLLKMLFDYIGEEACRNGLRSYFAKHAFGNTERGDLWQEFSSASKTDVHKLMTPWLEKPGLPMLKVSAGKDKLELEQSRFLLDGEDSRSIWPVPLLSDRKLPRDILLSKSAAIDRKDGSSQIFNANGSGHYIVNYTDKQSREQIKEKIISQSMSPSGRINAINDMLLLAQKSEYSLRDVLDMVAKCGNEPRDSVWSLLIRTLGFAGMLSEGDEACEVRLRKLKGGLADNWHTKLGWDDQPADELNTKLLRHTVLALKIASEEKDILAEALKRFASTKNVEQLPAEQRAMLAAAEVKFGDKSSIDKLLKEYETTSNPEVQHAIAAGLCSTKDPAVGQKLIGWGLAAKGKVKAQDVPRWFAYLMRNRHTRQHAWQWLTTDWDRISEAYGKSIDNFVVYASSPLSTPQYQKEFSNFFGPKQDIVALNRAIKIALSAIDTRIKWRKSEEPKLKEYLKKQT